MESSKNDWNPKLTWRRFRLELEAAKNYPIYFSLDGDVVPRNIFLEQLLPTLLYVKGAAILDDSLKLWLNENGHLLSDPYRDDLNGRLSYLYDHQILNTANELHPIRKLRNELAHKPGAVCDWSILERDVSLIENNLVALALAVPTQKLECIGERSAIQASAEPGISFLRRYTVTVREAGSPALELSWTKKYHEGE